MTTDPGIYRGIVVDNADPLSIGRIRVQIPQVLGSTPSGWAMPAWAQHDLTVWPQDRLPAVGQGVWVMFEGPDRLTWVSVFGAVEYPLGEHPELYESTLDWDFLILPEGQDQLISGTLSSPSGVPNPNPMVYFQKSPDKAAWESVVEAAVSIDGAWSVTYARPLAEQSWWFRAMYSGLPPFTPAFTDPAQIKESNTRLTWNSPVLPWKTVTNINGTLKTNTGISVEDAEIEIAVREPGGAWHTSSKAVVGIDATWSTTFERTTAMVNEIEMRALFKGADLDPTVNVRPDPVIDLRATATASSILVSWTNPSVFDLDHIVIRREVGSLAPVNPGDGAAVTPPSPLAQSVTDGPLTVSTYSYGVWTVDNLGLTSVRRTASATIAPVLPAPPLGGTWPNADTTGVPNNVTPVLLTEADRPYPNDVFGGPGNNTLQVKTPNATYTGWNIQHFVEVRAPGVTFRNCNIEGPASWVTPATAMVVVSNAYAPRPSVLLDRCTIIPQKLPNMVSDGVRGSNATVRFCEISRVIDGCKIYGIMGNPLDPLGGNFIVEDSWIHDLTHYPNPPDVSNYDGTHNDGIQIVSGSTISIKRNRFDGSMYHAGIYATQSATDAPVAALTFEANYFSGENASIHIYDSDQQRATPITGITVKNNVYNKEALRLDYGLLVSARTDFASNITYTGNVWSDASTPAPTLLRSA